MHPWLSRGLAALALIVACAAPPAVAETTSYPDRPVHLVVGFPPGGPVDVVARALGQELEKLLGQPVVIENRAGAGGIIGTEAVARAAPDGYTLLLATTTLTIQETLYKNLTYSALRDFTPVAAIAAGPQVLIVNKDVPAKNVQELIALAKSKPGQLNYASPSTGGANHLAGEMLKTMAGIDVMHIPYKGGAPAETDLIGGRVTFMFASLPAAYRSFGRAALAAFRTVSATTPGGSAVAITSFNLLFRPSRASLYSSSLASASTKFVSNGVFVYAGSMIETRMPLVRSSWSSDSEYPSTACLVAA